MFLAVPVAGAIDGDDCSDADVDVAVDGGDVDFGGGDSRPRPLPCCLAASVPRRPFEGSETNELGPRTRVRYDVVIGHAGIGCQERGRWLCLSAARGAGPYKLYAQRPDRATDLNSRIG